MQAASEAFEAIFGQKNTLPLPLTQPFSGYLKFRPVIRLAALLHDVGHGPLSHTTEFAMPQVKDLKLPIQIGSSKIKDRKATHEDYTLKIILDSPLTPPIEKAGSSIGFKPLHVAALIEPKIEIQDGFFVEGGVNFRPILQQLISSELDADRMDYLRRDSLHTGVSYGQFDFEWLVGNLTGRIVDQKCYLALGHRALYAFEDFLLSRFHMFLMVYFHHKSVIYDEMLAQYLNSPDCSYLLPADIEKYCEYNDAHLSYHLYKSPHPWARRIADRNPYKILVELHSGIPAAKAARAEQEKLLNQIKEKLARENIHFLTSTSTSELSKYFRHPGDPIFVRYDNHYNDPSFIPLEQCTDLFQKYEEKRSITRLYVAAENLFRSVST
jgi:HD superfamily phosphohydrolase